MTPRRSWLGVLVTVARRTAFGRQDAVMSVVLPDICVRAVEELAGGGQAVLLEREPHFPANGSVSVLGLTPAGETNLPDDGVDVIDDVLDDHRDVAGGVLAEDLRERSDVWIRQDADLV